MKCVNAWSALSFLLVFTFNARNAEGLKCLVCDDMLKFPEGRSCTDLDEALTMSKEGEGLENFTLDSSIECNQCVNGTIQKDVKNVFRGCWTPNNTLMTTIEERHQVSMPDFSSLINDNNETGEKEKCTTTRTVWCLETTCVSDDFCNVPNPPQKPSTPWPSFPMVYILTAGASALIVISLVLCCCCWFFCCSSRGQYNLDGVAEV